MKPLDARSHESSGSRLPREQAYWNGLAARISTASEETVRAYGRAGTPWWSPFADWAPALAACAALAVLGTWAFAPPAQATATVPDEVVIERALWPADPLAASMVAPQPPSMGGLLFPTEGGP